MSPLSPTQQVLTPTEVADYIEASFSGARQVADCGPLTGGGFATVWWVRLDDGAQVVLKVGPPPQVPLLRYESGMLAAEARYFRLVAARAPQVPVPPLLHHTDLLDQVRRPALLHFDGWDGNVLAAPDTHGAYRMCGLVDGERFLYGDPMLDLVSPLLFRRAEDEPEHPFLHGYADAVGTPLVFDDRVRRRLALYRMHLHLLMTVEMPSRGITVDNDPGRHTLLAELLDRDLADLSRP
ncbi:hypothetical protein [Micromonospora sp. DT229]|uniref:hypothetical protein n=1 Tax=Micromonospora sp. DT229 TaxID=3393430 RepID=UPI003CE99550